MEEAALTPTGLSPDPATVREPIIQVFAAPAFGRRGALGVHTWIVAKRTGAPTFTRYDVVGWTGPPYVHVDYLDPDALWFGSMPVLLADRRGDGVEALIGRIDEAVRRYPYADTYRTWPGPNSNTFVAHVARAVPELRLDLPANAVGKDYLPLASAIASAPSGSGVQLSVLGLAGVLVAAEEGIEINLLGLTLGIDIARPALRLSGLGRVGLAKPGR
ncbi:MAG: DUF3750 domain-containing protein [Sulfuritalea sp.]|nr:DUF3750 domain-containing protein [Sulfuritalea sp.]